MLHNTNDMVQFLSKSNWIFNDIQGEVNDKILHIRHKTLAVFFTETWFVASSFKMTKDLLCTILNHFYWQFKST
ncbi:Uncharacterised protein [Streptococcus pneumoniae]|nr:Uncharacterised protein [Streptococcus pneumoniae]